MSDTVATEEIMNWVVRIVRRDNESRMYWYDKNANINSRVSSAMKMPKEVAVQFAKSINDQCKDYKARAYRYETSVAQQAAKTAASKIARKPDSLKTVEQVELEDLRRENAMLKMMVANMQTASCSDNGTRVSESETQQ